LLLLLLLLLCCLQVKVKRRGSDKKFVASVLAVGTECDIGERQQHMLLWG
jgi:hypothetical protein